MPRKQRDILAALADKLGGEDGKRLRSTLERFPPLGVSSWDDEITDEEYERRLKKLKLLQMIAFLNETKLHEQELNRSEAIPWLPN